jgi:hypothetical protein
MSAENTITNAEQAEKLPVGQWVTDANGIGLCLVDTNVGWPQRMWMSIGGDGYTAIDYADYPLRLADIDEEPGVCPHPSTNECGHCKRCGVVVEAPKDLDWHLTIVRGDHA